MQADLRFDAAVNHRATDFPAHLAAACPNGIDVYFENVGGAIWQAVLPLLNQGARVPVCGLIAQYNGVGQGDGTDWLFGGGTDKLPETYLVIRGQVVRKWVGATDWDDPALRAEIAARLKGADKTAALELP